MYLYLTNQMYQSINQVMMVNYLMNNYYMTNSILLDMGMVLY